MGCLVMKKIIVVLGILCLMLGVVSATDCTGYFTKAADKRIKVVSAASSLELTTERLASRADDLYNTLDDMNNDENLTSASDDFTDFVDRKNDASEDMSNLKSALDAYDNAISDSRDDLPNACFKVFNMYDGDLSDVDDYYSNVRSAWNKFTPRYDIIAGYRSNLASHKVSEAKPKMDDIRDYIDDVYSEVTNNLATTINATTGATDEKIYNQTECFGMVTKNVDIAIKECNAKCNDYVNKKMQNCTSEVTPTTIPQNCQDCTSLILNEKQRTSDCENRYTALSGSCQKNCPICSDTVDKDNRITGLSNENAELKTQIASAVSNYNSANRTVTELTKKVADLEAAPCSCTIWIIIAVVLALVIIVAWLFTM